MESDKLTTSFGVLSFIEDNNLVILNDGSPTRIHPSTHTLTNIDLTITSPSLAGIANWHVNYEAFTSDHFLITTNILLDNNNKNSSNKTYPSENKLNFNKTDWVSYTDLTGKIDGDAVEHEDINIHYFNFLTFINKCTRETTPLSTTNPSKQPTPWWSKKCSIVIKERNKAKRKYIKTLANSDLEFYKKMKAKAQKTLRQEKKIHWQKFCNNLNRFTPTKKIWEKIKNMSNKKSVKNNNFPILQNDIYIHDSETKCNLIADHFADKLQTEHNQSKITPETNTEQTQTTNNNTTITNTNPPVTPTSINDPFNLQELQYCLNSLNNSAPGPDNIHKYQLTYLHNNSKLALLNLLNRSWQSGQLPVSWHHAVVIPIPKLGKDKEGQ